MVKKIKPYRAHFRAVVDKDTFEEAQEILEILNLTIGQVIGMLCTQIVLHRKLPFEIKDNGYLTKMEVNKNMKIIFDTEDEFNKFFQDAFENQFKKNEKDFLEFIEQFMKDNIFVVDGKEYNASSVVKYTKECDAGSIVKYGIH